MRKRYALQILNLALHGQFLLVSLELFQAQIRKLQHLLKRKRMETSLLFRRTNPPLGNSYGGSQESREG
jgi:hypothetical protein